jgi:hypothetical protein
MTNTCSIEMMFVSDVFDMGGGYVLNFSDRTFAQFFAEELTINREVPPNHVLEHKGPRAAETGLPFIRVRDLFPR